MKATPEQQLRFLSRDVLPVLGAIINGFDYNPGHSDLDDEQPITVRMTLGDYRRASRIAGELDRMEPAHAAPEHQRGFQRWRGCYAHGCEEDARYECENCGKPFCSDHGQRGGDRQVQDVGAVAYASICGECMERSWK